MIIGHISYEIYKWVWLSVVQCCTMLCNHAVLFSVV